MAFPRRLFLDARVEARTKADVQKTESQSKADAQRMEAESRASAQRLAAQGNAEVQRLQTEVEIKRLQKREQNAQAYAKHPALLRMLELETLNSPGTLTRASTSASTTHDKLRNKGRRLSLQPFD